MTKEHTYHLELVITGEKSGRLTPKGLSPQLFTASTAYGGDPSLWTSKEYLLGALASCLMLTFQALVEKVKIPVEIVRVPIEGILTEEGGGLSSFSRFIVRPELKAPTEHQVKAEELLEKAHKYCLISRSLKGEVTIDPRFV
ncbi:MAG: hypothetical protein A3I05_03985 [Deltaproteobacteria bacterium RIFCSPLOWO2_02_FULL_44_10]|nr:MAG: hypothetical protein A3C46_03860 [Deltaproteobacteria bacterium RIFCSPHIGHO2_02_FULL_44_16]OGQ46308.1 MAG: hypothetical protein A3I05_03985 [Deltaproteobacteria bacterium RIFCSPLOWO2_02_FULL_44_10]